MSSGRQSVYTAFHCAWCNLFLLAGLTRAALHSSLILIDPRSKIVHLCKTLLSKGVAFLLEPCGPLTEGGDPSFHCSKRQQMRLKGLFVYSSLCCDPKHCEVIVYLPSYCLSFNTGILVKCSQPISYCFVTLMACLAWEQIAGHQKLFLPLDQLSCFRPHHGLSVQYSLWS